MGCVFQGLHTCRIWGMCKGGKYLTPNFRMGHHLKFHNFCTVLMSTFFLFSESETFQMMCLNHRGP